MATTTHLLIVGRNYAPPVPLAIVAPSLACAINGSWSWEGCTAAHAGAEWVEWFCERQFTAMTMYSANHPDYPFWDFYQGYFWTSVPATNASILSATLRPGFCYVTDWPTQTGEVAWHFGTWTWKPEDELALRGISRMAIVAKAVTERHEGRRHVLGGRTPVETG